MERYKNRNNESQKQINKERINMTIEEHLIDVDQEGKEIEVEIDSINDMRIVRVEFPLPNKPLNFMQFIVLRQRVVKEMLEYTETHTCPTNPLDAAEQLANKMKEVLTKHYKSMGVL